MGRLIFFSLLFMLLVAVIPLSVFAQSALAAVMEKKCTLCHDYDLVTEKKAYQSEWENIVARMVAYDRSQFTAVDSLLVLKYIKENLALDGPGGRKADPAQDQ
ncbi:MAG TPA: hypothetical protein ENN66_08430 [Proteobacteria bacterium]|mgnify:CR=1 FL=1|nr:hypothetical protein [Pseudomonadota bacterium]